jgi:hypothetical protein
MHLILLLVGLALAAAGVAMLRYAVPIEDMAGAALFTSGVVALVGALIVAGLAAAVRSLNRIAERLYIQPLPLPPVAAVGREDPAPRATRAAPAPSADAARPSLLGWLGRGGASAPIRAPSLPQGAAPASDPAAALPVDLAPLTRIPELPRDAPPSPAPIPRVQPKPAAAPNGTPASTVYRSGVIDGMAYTLFMDGSIQAELPQGTVKFASVDELQKYLLGNRQS